MASLHLSTRPVRKSRAHGSKAKSSASDDGRLVGTQTLARARIKITTRHKDVVKEAKVQQLLWSLESAVPTQPSKRLLPFKFRSQSRVGFYSSHIRVRVVAQQGGRGEREREKECRKVFSSTIYAVEKDE